MPTASEVARGQPQRPRTVVDATLAALTPRERRVIGLLARRRTNKEIAAELHIAPGTAKRHVENILNKAGLRSRRDIEPVMSLDA
jgi:DNA-binding NarL/FixJ family response regulator